MPGIVGLGKACEIAARDLPFQMDRLNTLRNSLKKRIVENIPDLAVNGHPFRRLPHILSVSFRLLSGETIVRELDERGIAASAGAACMADVVTVSHVLVALNVPKEFAMGTVRFSLGRGNREAEISHAADVLKEIVEKLRAAS